MKLWHNLVVYNINDVSYRNYDINPGYKDFDIKNCVSYRNYYIHPGYRNHDLNPGYRGYDTDIYIQKNTSYCGHCHEY